MSFPDKNIFGFKKGWKDLGKMEYKFHSFAKNGDRIVQYDTHSFCNTNLNVGKDHDGSLFKFCPRCLIKIDSLTK